MDVFKFLEEVGAEIACNRATVGSRDERVIVARVVDGEMTLTDVGAKMAVAHEAEAPKRSRKSAKSTPDVSEAQADGNG